MRRCRVQRLDGDPAARHRQVLEMGHHQQHGHEGRQRRPVRGDAVEPRDVRLIVGREFGPVVVVGREVLMNSRVRVARIGVVPMLRRQSRGEGETRHQREADDRRAQFPQHTVIMVA